MIFPEADGVGRTYGLTPQIENACKERWHLEGVPRTWGLKHDCE